MKRYLLATLLLSVLLPLGASAQWYLFPGSRHAKDSTKVERRDPFKPIGIEEEKAETVEEEFALTRVALILPLRSTGTPNGNFLDFYSGVLMAADNLSSSERHYEISVFDSTVGLPGAGELEQSDIIIGPVSYDDVEKMLPRAHGKYIVSPLDPKVASLTDRHNIIQAPSGWEAQVDELVRWIGDDLRGGDAVVLLQSADERGGAITSRLALKLGEAGIPYEITSTPASKEGMVQGTCRFVIASENDEFCSAAIREIALMNIRGGRNAVYSTSKLRSLSDLEVESLHAAATRITATYYADPNDLSVKRFADKYRRMFKGDPGQWVYQGYDLMNYFGSILNKDPDYWYAGLAGAPGKGLQTDFSFDATGKTNTAVRRLRYNANNTISLVR
ncbi:MAG: hypothetical protein J5640_07450 [Bacteroidales bacterium]|nr:hypothetical protein [Bacteroidales bacterium]